MNRLLLFVSLAAIVTSTAAGCAGGMSMRTPEGFVRLGEGGDYDRRFTNSDGIVVGVREMDNDPRGNLRFWTGTVAARLGQRYEAVGTEPVQTRSGLRGNQLRWRANIGGRSWIYWTTLFVDGDTVYVIEATGDEEVFGTHEPAIAATIASFTTT